MAIKIDKALNKAYLIQALQDAEKYWLWDKETRQVVDVPEHYEQAASGLTIVATGTLSDSSTEIEIQNVTPVLTGYTPQVGDIVTLVADTFKTVDINVHRYGKLASWKTGKKYFIGDACVYNNCLYQAIADSDGTDVTFPAAKFQMVGAASTVKIVENALPVASTVDSDSIFWLKEDEMDSSVPPEVVNKAGIYTFDKATGTYAEYRPFEDTDLDFSEIWDSTQTATYTGDADKVVSSEYFYNNLKSFGDKVWDEVKDIYDIAGHPHYIILADSAELAAYDLTTLPDNSVNILLVKKDDTVDKYEENANPGTYITVEDYEQAVADYAAGTRPTDPAVEYTPVYKYLMPGTTNEFYSNLYICLCDDDSTPRKADYIGKLAYGEKGLDTAVQDMIDREVKTELAYHYEKCASSDTGALLVVADGTLAGTIKQSLVTPLFDGATNNISDIVISANAYKLNAGGTGVYTVKDSPDASVPTEILTATANASRLAGEAAFVDGDTVDTVTAYKNDTVGLTVVADNYSDTVIEKSNVTPVLPLNTVINVGDYVYKNTIKAYGGYKFLEKADYDEETLKKISHTEVTYTDPDGVAADVKVDYLTYNSNKLMYNEFETVKIDFDDPDDYEPITEGEI